MSKDKKEKIIEFNWQRVITPRGEKRLRVLIPLSEILPKILPELRNEYKLFSKKIGIKLLAMPHLFLDYLEQKYGKK